MTAPRSMSTSRWCFLSPTNSRTWTRLSRPLWRRWPIGRKRAQAISSSSRRGRRRRWATGSPVGQAAWIYEKMWALTDNQGNPEDALTLDEMLDNIMLYWLPGNATSSARLYWESVANVAPTQVANVASTRLELPVGVSIYPRETNRPSRRWVDRWMSNLIHYNILDRGGHFAAWEQPALHAKEIRDCFAKVRLAWPRQARIRGAVTVK